MLSMRFTLSRHFLLHLLILTIVFITLHWLRLCCQQRICNTPYRCVSVNCVCGTTIQQPLFCANPQRLSSTPPFRC